jgi:hypothetical protein
MERIISAFLLLTALGCQTNKHTCPTDPQTDKITVLISQLDAAGKKTINLTESAEYEVSFSILKGDGVVAPKLTTHPKQWASLNSAVNFRNLEQKAQILIEDEEIEINCEPGFHIKLMVVPLEDGLVHIKGAYALSERSERNLTKQKELFPFSAYCRLEETITLYELKTILEPVN